MPFTLDPDVFSNTYTQDELYRHEKLIELWQQVGCFMVAGSSESGSRFYIALNDAPTAIRKRWQIALKQLRRSCCVVDFDPDENNESSEWISKLSNSVEVISLEATRAFCWGLPEDQYSITKNGVTEICRFGHESEAAIFKRARLLLNAPIEEGQSVHQVWVERFQQLALDSRTIVVTDRYALENFVKHRGAGYSGLERLMMELASLQKGKPRNLRLITGLPPEWSHTDLSQAVENIENFCVGLRGRSLRELQLFCGEGKIFCDHAHYRSIRFDDYQLFHIDTGLEPLAGERVKRTCPTSLLPWNHEVCKAYQKVEKEVLSQCRFKRHIPCQILSI
ncbi:MAG: hypothetical protein KA142_01940 [Chromatiaceae bacterium]|nr:hypothetical protein [Chromatiaceae bacterium]